MAKTYSRNDKQAEVKTTKTTMLESKLTSQLSPSDTNKKQDNIAVVEQPKDFEGIVEQQQPQVNEQLKIVEQPKIVEQKVENEQLKGNNFIRYRHKNDQSTEDIKKQQQKLLIQEELKKQIEEKQRGKELAKKKRLEEAEKEELRIAKEKRELDDQYKREAGIKVDTLNEKQASKGIPKIFQPSDDNSLVLQTSQNQKTKEVVQPKETEKPKEPIPVKESDNNLIEIYKKQIEELKLEQKKAIETALAYKEQLQIEREKQKPQYLIDDRPIKPLKPAVAVDQNVFEESLISTTKLVQVEDIKTNKDLYKTWSKIPILKSENHETKQVNYNEPKMKQIEESKLFFTNNKIVEENYSQASFESESGEHSVKAPENKLPIEPNIKEEEESDIKNRKASDIWVIFPLAKNYRLKLMQLYQI